MCEDALQAATEWRAGQQAHRRWLLLPLPVDCLHSVAASMPASAQCVSTCIRWHHSTLRRWRACLTWVHQLPALPPPLAAVEAVRPRMQLGPLEGLQLLRGDQDARAARNFDGI